jgi:RNA polymerase sigma-70 factor, ECF subfamily
MLRYLSTTREHEMRGEARRMTAKKRCERRFSALLQSLNDSAHVYDNRRAGQNGDEGTMLLPLILAIHATGGERELIERLQRRDAQALAELYDRYGRVVYSLILRVVRDGGIAEDLVQETFLRVWNRVQGFDSEKGSIGPWLLAVARNRAIDYLRSAGGRERNALEFEETDHPALYSDMEHDLLVSDKARRVKAAMAKLSPNQRQVIELAYFEGLSQTEMAERMGEPLGTVKTWVRTALKNLRDDLGAVVPA